jgi:hypothetical protein
MIPSPLLARYTIGEKSRKYTTEPDVIVVGPLSTMSGRSKVPSAIMPMIQWRRSELRYLISLGKTPPYTIGPAHVTLPIGLPSNLRTGARFRN